MKTLPVRLMVAGLGVLLASCASDSLVTRVEMSAPSGRCAAIEDQILDQVNDYRQAQGLGGLRRHGGLDALARRHAQFMLDNQGKFGLYGSTVTHYGFEERELMARRTMNIEALAENVIAGRPGGGNVGATLVRVWLGSPGHLSNISQKWGLTGIGVAADGEGCVCATQLFGTRGISQSRWAGPQLQD